MKCAIMRTKILTFLRLLLPTLDPMAAYARFLQNLPDYNDMTQEEFDKAFGSLSLPTAGPSPPGISIHAAIEASYIHRYTVIVSDGVYDIVLYFDMSISHMISYLISFAISFTIY